MCGVNAGKNSNKSAKSVASGVEKRGNSRSMFFRETECIGGNACYFRTRKSSMHEAEREIEEHLLCGF